ncbi:MAG TPA: HAD family phosphatase [Candidatus Limnocylindria bacterium]|nr:HAD family phosphatase [Candidatus Limnocylindria bacterium]
MTIRAVIFDLGGVVVGSPLHAIAAYERELGLAAHAVNRVVVSTGHAGAWARLERGELELEAFYPAFEADCAAAGLAIDAREMMRRIALATEPRPVMLEAVRRLRAGGLRVAALTNNWIAEEEGTRLLAPWFDVFIESAVVGMRKPDPRIFTYTCDALGVVPPETAFLDDIGLNLKAARALGMTTIKVDDPDVALDELAAVVGLPLR